MPFRPIDPQEDLDYSFDWSDFLDEQGSPSDVISTSSWSITPENDGSPTEPVVHDDSKTVSTTTVLVRNCERGQTYRLSNVITTTAGRKAERSITLRCEQR